MRFISAISFLGLALLTASPAVAQTAFPMTVGTPASKPFSVETLPAASAQGRTRPAVKPPPLMKTIAFSASPAPMSFSIARSVSFGCPQNCAAWIVADGPIVKTTAADFRAFLAKLGDRKLPLLIHSPGGDVDNALQIARMIRARGLDVMVAKTNTAFCNRGPQACGQPVAGEISGEATGSGAMCNSACVFVLAAGVRRMSLPNAYIGVHRVRSTRVLTTRHRLYNVQTYRRGFEVVSTQRTLISENVISHTEVTDQNGRRMAEKLNPFLKEMGVGLGLVGLMDSTPHDSVRRLWSAELQSLSLLTHDISDTGLVTKRANSMVEGIAIPLGGLAGRDIAARISFYSAGPETSLTLLAEPATAAKSLSAFFQPRLASHRAVRSAALNGAFYRAGHGLFDGPMLMAMSKATLCGLRYSRGISLNLGAFIRGSRIVGLPYRLDGPALFRSSGFFDSICI